MLSLPPKVKCDRSNYTRIFTVKNKRKKKKNGGIFATQRFISSISKNPLYIHEKAQKN